MDVLSFRQTEHWPIVTKDSISYREGPAGEVFSEFQSAKEKPHSTTTTFNFFYCFQLPPTASNYFPSLSFSFLTQSFFLILS